MSSHSRARRYACSVLGCGRPAYAKGYCNAHYIRMRTGRDMEAPIRPTVRSGCMVAGCSHRHYGQGYCKRHYGLWRRWSMKVALVERLGGVCSACGGSFPPEVFDFHHRDPSAKAYSPSARIGNGAFEDVLPEVEKCDLLCANCHRVEHAKYNGFDFRKGPDMRPVRRGRLRRRAGRTEAA